MIREKKALRYAKELREFVDNMEAYCNESWIDKSCVQFCADCKYYEEHSEIMGNTDKINDALTAIIKALEETK